MNKTFLSIVVVIISLVMPSCAGNNAGNNAGEQADSVDDVVEITPSFTEAVHQYDELNQFSEGLAAVKKDDKFGYIDTKGELVVPCQYQYAGQFKEGLACVVNDNISFIDAKGELLHTNYPLTWYYTGDLMDSYLGSAISFTNGVCEIILDAVDTQKVFINKQLKEVAQPAEESTQSEGNLEYEIFRVSGKDIYGEETSLVGVKDKDGKIVIPAKYDYLEICDNGIVLATMFTESAESKFYGGYQGEDLTIYGYIDFTGKSTFTDADMGKLEGYKEAQLHAMSQLKLEQEEQALLEEERRQEEYTETSHLTYNSSGDNSSFRTSNDVMSYLSGKTFKDQSNQLSARINYDAIYLNGAATTATPRISNITSTSATIRAQSPYMGGQDIVFYLNSTNGTLTLQSGETLYLSR